MEKHVVVILPHPDDESFGAAGTIAEFRSQGIPVTYLCGTLGEMGRNMGNPPFANRETLPEIRKQELKNACDVLDMDLQMLGYRDKTIEFEDRTEVANHLQRILEDVKPSLVITHYPGYAVHPDHNALGAAAIQAVEQMEEDHRPVVWAQAFARGFQEKLGNPDVINDVEAYFETKMEAILCHQSQAGGIIGKLKDYKELGAEVLQEAKTRFGKEVFFIWKFQ
ncbi:MULTISPECIES: bacillithiol biosynthesis deacetylase BshB2 [Clostridia]|uniref:bacillithiol biosynthesis deacetylase BshB2 n=1 Tax=Clostridia TaxID=186801 RepID=UPI000EA0DF8E|nr:MULTISPECIES: bacillithiol biosynthesis deacetylase BshB2 [Clostridia]NBJ69621.1 bacillithiol biosynthesis deacetylase BshB2 [Roseburia sp. 1XD42-34]RKI78322.1 bacillithiol biosynthesis deacetylase BshB2 [Clostridium sp. 1xD42-85]